ncbi:nitroreductase family protein [Alkalihalobacillus sp. BA299]|uniref:nitroreductase family protein n=1 Tax=Alkalihalobacillus sp. BA299 TaxID=2815938 RepID=UPI001FFE0912|nr:nitroreductase family protein [Alkalihalobacillus sp. BA299]
MKQLKTRRSIGIVKQDPIPKEYIEKILEAGTFAPNHFRTEPWRFFVLTGESREKLGPLFAEITKTKTHDPSTPEMAYQNYTTWMT